MPHTPCVGVGLRFDGYGCIAWESSLGEGSNSGEPRAIPPSASLRPKPSPALGTPVLLRHL